MVFAPQTAHVDFLRGSDGFRTSDGYIIYILFKYLLVPASTRMLKHKFDKRMVIQATHPSNNNKYDYLLCTASVISK